jgi:hypothetical protein
MVGTTKSEMDIADPSYCNIKDPKTDNLKRALKLLVGIKKGQIVLQTEEFVTW